MKALRIVFMGTPDFAVPSLEILLEHSYHVAGVVTAPDKPAGRGQKLQESAVKKYAVSKNLNVLQPFHLKDESFLEELKSWKANLQIVVAFRMLPKVVWSMPEYGTFNLHASLLPDYRGAAPINWAIINGERKTGVTTFFINDTIDTGAIILQKKVEISETETAGTLHDTLMNKGAALVLKTVVGIAQNNVHPIQQPAGINLKTAPKIHRETCQINWGKTVAEIDCFIRGLSPYPTAWTMLKNNGADIPVKIYSATAEQIRHPYQNGWIWHDKKQWKVAAGDGFIHLKTIQLPNKRKMNVQEALNGFVLPHDACLE